MRLFRPFALLTTLCVFFSTNALVAQELCDPDFVPPTPICNAVTEIAIHPTLGRTIYPSLIDEGSFDACSAIAPENYRLELLDDYEENDVPASTSLFLPPTTTTTAVALWVGDAAGNWNACFAAIEVTGFATMVSGQIYDDADSDCTLDDGEEILAYGSWPVTVRHLSTGEVYSTITQVDGSYSLIVDDLPVGAAGDLEVQIEYPTGLYSNCPNSVQLANNAEGALSADFAFSLADDCNYLTVDIGTPFLRRCFTNRYVARYCNYSSFPIFGAEIVVRLDEFLVLENASLPFTDLGNNDISFTIPFIQPGECGTIGLDILATCDVELGQHQCVQAKIQPHDCIVPSPLWSGASIEVDGGCEGDKVQFQVRNKGAESISTPLNFNVVEDVVMYMEGTIDNLPAGEATSFEYDANGATWHFRVDQAEGHPGELAPIAFVEGCGGLTPDIVNQFSFNDADPFVAIDCQPAIGAFDPNDKLAYPKGYGDQNYIEANELIEYKIRFQNTGTDTAFNVVLEDQLSEWLDPSTIKLGASSHPYRMEIDENATMRFYFDNILLPDSTTNEPASHGFVQFQIEQQLDNPLGTVIENFADIFFDFNEPIRTNTVFHTIGEAFVLVNTIEGPAVETLSLKWLPNPAREEVRFEFEDYEVKDGHLELLDQQGRRLHVQVFSGKQTRLIRQLEWPNGLYFFRLTDSKGLHVAGKLQLN